MRGRVRLTVAKPAAEESPPTYWARSHMQVWVARVTAMAQKRHGLPLAMMRPSKGFNTPVREVRPARDNSQSAGAGYDETVNPCGCKPEQDDGQLSACPGMARS